MPAAKWKKDLVPADVRDRVKPAADSLRSRLSSTPPRAKPKSARPGDPGKARKSPAVAGLARR